jgi:hypothetical protein
MERLLRRSSNEGINDDRIVAGLNRLHPLEQKCFEFSKNES